MALFNGNYTKHINAYCGHNARCLYRTPGGRYVMASVLRRLKLFVVAVSDDISLNPTSVIQLNLSCPFLKLQIFAPSVINKYQMKFSTMSN
jgi:hypothetical protein